jgi:NADH:ubiquinone oxidoreductase subunit F (NADH-binding)
MNGPATRVIEEVETAGLRGRGGAGFPTGRKLRLVAEAAGEERYIVCNADESEPLVFKDRVMIDTNPHKILEGMALAAYATGAQTGFIYIRGEYAGQARRLEAAIHQAEVRGCLGEKVQGTDFSFHIHVHRGAGAYICGEETALLESLEGRRGEPRIRPPFPAAAGYHGQPTVVNNVETFATIPGIIANGPEWYRKIGPPETPGTKLYTILGHVNRPGLFEAPYGLTLRQIIEVFGGGMQPGSEFHFALTGGAAGTIVPAGLLDTPIDYTSTTRGISLGAGAFLICDQTVSPVVLLREVMFFFEAESCGKCTPCRLGTQQARQTLDRIIAGKGTSQDRRRLAELADLMQNASFCGLGQSTAIPIKSTMKQFEQYFS